MLYNEGIIQMTEKFITSLNQLVLLREKYFPLQHNT